MPRAPDLPPTASELVARLTPNQLACMRLVQRRLDSEQIAFELGIPKTAVNDRIRSAIAKLGAPNRREAARILDLADAEDEIQPAPSPAPPEA